MKREDWSLMQAHNFLLQLWLCFARKGHAIVKPLWAQIVAGVLYAAAILVFSRDLYLS
jgi:hypothetical protein